MSGVRTYRIVLDKEPWENVPQIVYKSCQAFDASLLQIQNWTKDQEKRNKEVRETQQYMDERLDSTAADVQALRDRIEEMAAQSTAMADSHQRDGGIYTRCLWHLLHTTREHLTHLGDAFDVDSPLAPVVEERLKQAAADPPETLTVRDLIEPHQALESVSSKLDNTFDQWRAVRAQEAANKTSLETNLTDLAAESVRTQERLLAWREMLKESSHAIDALGGSLAAMRGDVETLQGSQVKKADVDEAVQLSAAELEDKLASNSGRVEMVSDRLSQLMTHVDSGLEELLRATEERIERHSVDVASLLERHLNPVSAYLNSMNIKADTARTELDAVKEQVPKLATELQTMHSQFMQSGQEDRDRAHELEGRVQVLEQSTARDKESIKDLDNSVTTNLSSVADDLGKRIDDIGTSLSVASSELDALRGGDVAQLAKWVADLESKMARWVHAQPLPAKISEARLYSLETRLAQEMDARLQFEDRMRQAPQSTTIDALQLPVLSKTATQAAAGGGSARRKYPVVAKPNVTPRASDKLEILSSQGTADFFDQASASPRLVAKHL